jgi:hypothetical protein
MSPGDKLVRALRLERIATEAMHGLIAHCSYSSSDPDRIGANAGKVAEIAVRFADALIAELDRVSSQSPAASPLPPPDEKTSLSRLPE